MDIATQIQVPHRHMRDLLQGITFCNLNQNKYAMELLSQKVIVGKLTIEICVHDLSYRMGLSANEPHQDHLFVNLVAKDSGGLKMWTTAILADNGKVKAYSTVSDALADARRRITESSELFSK